MVADKGSNTLEILDARDLFFKLPFSVRRLVRDSILWTVSHFFQSISSISSALI